MKLRHLLAVTALLCSGGRAVADERVCPSLRDPDAHRLIEATCRHLRQSLAEVPGATVRLSSQPFVDPRFGCTREGCVVALAGSFRALGEQASPDSWLGEYLEARGWSRTLSHDADGPDGTTYALHRPGALCVVEGRWTHWHDEKGQSHTEDAYEVTVSCGRAERRAPRPPE